MRRRAAVGLRGLLCWPVQAQPAPQLPRLALIHPNASWDDMSDTGRPAELPFEQPTRVYLVANLESSAESRVELPAAMVWHADEVSE